MNIKLHEITFGDNNLEFYQNGNSFINKAVSVYTDLNAGRIAKQIANREGHIVFYFSWQIKTNDSEIIAELKATYLFENANELPSLNELIKLVNTAKIDILKYFNNELIKRNINVATRTIDELDVENKRVLSLMIENAN